MSSLIPTSARSDEFPAEASVWPAALDRREFLGVMGASVALAGLAGCKGSPKALVPYVTQPESVVPGVPAFYASAVAIDGYARGILVEAHEGRPTKIEGNPRQSESLGATDAVTQASVLGLYDPDRSQVVTHRAQIATWSDFEAAWQKAADSLRPGDGRGLAVLTEPTTSPTLRREIHRLLDRYPAARWFQHTALARYDEAGGQPDYDFSAADIVLAIEGDFLDRHPAALRYARAFAGRRRIEQGRVAANRVYALEAAWTLAGTMADHRLAVGPERMASLLAEIAAGVNGGSTLPGSEASFVAGLVEDLRKYAPRVLCVAGAEQPPEVRAWVREMNHQLGAIGRTVSYRSAVRSDGDYRCAGDLATLAGAMVRKEVSALAILGCNPAHTAPADLAFAARLASVQFSLHCGAADETAALCHWHLPESHYLEAWSDLRGYNGAAVIQQPLIEPRYDTRSQAEVLRLLADGSAVAGYDLVRETWRGLAGAEDFEGRWTRWLNVGEVEENVGHPDGVAAGIASMQPGRRPGPPEEMAGDIARMQPGQRPGLQPEKTEEGLYVLFRADPNLGDGRWANNGWLQELPRPFTTLVWDNALLISPGLAREHKWVNGDVARLACGDDVLEAPVWIVPGQADACVVAHLGGGRSRAGTVGDARGFDAYRLRVSGSLWQRTGATLTPTGRQAELAATQHHFTMEGRDLARSIARVNLPTIPAKAPAPSLYADWPPDRYAWGMSIDLSTCFGCNACVAACQAENNIPVVGKEQVQRGREMHWIRIDRYYSGDETDPQVLAQPVPCMHCEHAPCEVVCPVAATVHSSEGLNEMVYNRCVGTRYCSNNCPYKVRRFNFFDYRAAADSPLHLQDNPNVTVRERGVMEKCTYCVQRISTARISAERENRPIRDGEIRTACQQACPAEAIVFGNLADPHSAVARRKAEAADYALLGELNTRPRTTYLPKLTNRHEA